MPRRVAVGVLEGAAGERVGLLLVQLEDLDRIEQLAVEFAVQMEGAEPRDPHQPLAVEGDAMAPRRQRPQELEREVAAQERREVDPLRPDRGRVDLRLGPRLADRVDVHPPAAVLVAQRERARAGSPEGRDQIAVAVEDRLEQRQIVA